MSGSPDNEDPVWVTAPEIAALTGRTVQTVHRWRTRGLMPSPMPRDDSYNGPYVWRRGEIEDWLKRGLKAG